MAEDRYWTFLLTPHDPPSDRVRPDDLLVVARNAVEAIGLVPDESHHAGLRWRVQQEGNRLVSGPSRCIGWFADGARTVGLKGLRYDGDRAGPS